MKKLFFPTATALMFLLLISCQTSNGRSGYYQDNNVQVIDVNPNKYLDTTQELPYEAIIQPKDIVISPVIDITTLQAETSRKTATVASAIIKQSEKKEEIETEIKVNPEVDTSLKEEEYGVTSGSLAVSATQNSFRYINSDSSFTGAIATYDFIEGQIYEIITSPKAITDFRLKPGESIAGQPIVNNSTTSWQFTMGTSIENGETIQHLFIKPSIVGLDTSMIILTNQRTYYFRVASFEESYMTALRFNYPIDSGKGYFVTEDFENFISEQNKAKEETGYTINMSNVNYNYKISKYKGNPTWIPQSCFSDGLKTYIQFPIVMLKTDEMPSVYVEKGGAVTLVNYRVKGNVYMIDTIISDDQRILLKSSEKEQVRITRAY